MASLAIFGYIGVQLNNNAVNAGKLLARQEAQLDRQSLENAHFELRREQFSATAEALNTDIENWNAKNRAMAQAVKAGEIITAAEANAANAAFADVSTRHEALKAELSQMESDYNSTSLASIDAGLPLKQDIAAHNATVDMTTAYGTVLIPIGLISLILSLLGFWLWYYRLQKHQDAMVERQAAASPANPP